MPAPELWFNPPGLGKKRISCKNTSTVRKAGIFFQAACISGTSGSNNPKFGSVTLRDAPWQRVRGDAVGGIPPLESELTQMPQHGAGGQRVGWVTQEGVLCPVLC